MLYCFVFQIEHRFLNKKHLLLFMYANFLKYLFRKLINWEQKCNFNAA